MDSLNGFRQASERIENGHIKQVFKQNETISLKMWDDLSAEIAKRGGDIKTKGTLKGAVNHIWMKLKAEINHNDLNSFIKNIIFCEEFNIERYHHVISEKIPSPLKNLLNDHLNALTNRVRDLKALSTDS